MKWFIILALIASCLADTLAFKYRDLDKPQSQVMSFDDNTMKSGPIMMRGITFHLECYNGFLPMINSLAARARDASNGCVTIANFEKDQEIAELQNSRSAVAEKVEQITKSLTDCSNKEGLEYFLCLKNNAEVNRKIMEDIKEASKVIVSQYNRMVKEIDSREQSCILRAVENAKTETNQAYIDLKSCILEGPVLQTKIGEDEISDTQQQLLL